MLTVNRHIFSLTGSLRGDIIIFLVVMMMQAACKTATQSENTSGDGEVYKLSLKPKPGSSYHYDIVNEANISMEFESKQVDNVNKSDIGVNYSIDKDSTGNLLFTMRYDKISIYSKNGDTETKADASNGSSAINQVDRMLGILKEATLVATVTPAGEVQQINGYQEIGDKVLSGFAANDMEGREIARKQWEQMIGDGLVKKNMDQLFKIFPDSAVHVKDSWKLTSREEGELGFNITSDFTLNAINNDIALVSSTGKITSSIKNTEVNGVQAVANLSGEQEAEFEMETTSGMLISCTIKATVKGTIQMFGQEVPVEIKSTVKMKGKKTGGI